MQVLGQKEKLDAIGATAVFVVHDDVASVNNGLLRGLDVDVPMLVDPARQAYEAWGMDRSSVAGIWLDPRVWLRYARLLAGGQPLLRPGGDTLQLGGDFVVDPAGIVTYARPQTRDDRPAVSALVDELRRAAGDVTHKPGSDRRSD